MANDIKKFRFTVKSGAGERLDTWLSQKIPQYSRNFLAKEIKAGRVWLGGRSAQVKSVVKAGQSVVAELQLPRTEIMPEKIDLDIIYQDKDLVVVNKPAGLVVHPAGKHLTGTLANALKHRFDTFYLVHRLDKDTSGVLLVALNQVTKNWLTKLFEKRQIKKTYLALLTGKITPQEAYLDLPIKRGQSGRFEALAGGRAAKSHYRVKEYLPGFSLVEVFPETGRTHQIRVHFQALRHPVAGDTMYGRGERGLNRQFLHAHKIEFNDSHGQLRSYTAPLPKDLSNFLKNLSR
ncbi:MAG: RluA family pseudouridine synthase [Patescibacteria group bacterium]|jgi:23S rRNA pseudouridine1911/1915/1917 synthase